MDGAQNIVLIGCPGTGKIHVATALGIQAIEHHHPKLRFFSTIEPVNALEQENAKGKAGLHIFSQKGPPHQPAGASEN